MPRFPTLEALQRLPVRDVAKIIVLDLADRGSSAYRSNYLRGVVEQTYNGAPDAAVILTEGLEHALYEGLLVHDPLSSAGAEIHPLKVSRKGQEFAARHGESHAWREVTARELMHSRIAEEALVEMARGSQYFPDAIFKAFRAVEIAVREVGEYEPSEIGIPLMRKAFGRNGPLTDPTQEPGEQDAVANLFAGAIGLYKNPASHRAMAPDTYESVLRALLLASELLVIVDDADNRIKERKVVQKLTS